MGRELNSIFFQIWKKFTLKNKKKQNVKILLSALIIFSGILPLFLFSVSFNSQTIDKSNFNPLLSQINNEPYFETTTSNYSKLAQNDKEIIQIHIFNGNNTTLFIWVNDNLFNHTKINNNHFILNIETNNLQIGENYLKLEIYSGEAGTSLNFLADNSLIIIIEESKDFLSISFLIIGILLISGLAIVVINQFRNKMFSNLSKKPLIIADRLKLKSTINFGIDLQMINTKTQQRMENFVLKDLLYINLDINDIDDSIFCKSLKKF